MLRLFRSKPADNLKSLTDEQLVNRYRQSHNQDIIGILFERYTHLLFTVSYKYLQNDSEAEDMVMFVFEKLFEELKRTEVQNFKSWLYTLCKNQCLMQLRQQKSNASSKEKMLAQLDEEIMELTTDLHLINAENDEHRIRYLEKALNELKNEQRQCIELFYLNQKSYKEVELITGLTYNEVKSHLQNGKRNLKQIIERMEHHD